MTSVEDRPWPRDDDRPFVPKRRKPPKTTGARIAALERALSPDYGYLYREAYYHGGEILAQRLLEKPRPIDTFPWVVLPILYCFRHYIEISLKALIEGYSKYADEPVDPRLDLHREHNLARLWNEVRRLEQAALPEIAEHDATDRNVERCINDFNQYDASSQTFRYEKDTTGKSVVERLPQVNIEQLMKTMRNLRAYFNGSDDYLGELMEQKHAYLEDLPGPEG